MHLTLLVRPILLLWVHCGPRVWSLPHCPLPWLNWSPQLVSAFLYSGTLDLVFPQLDVPDALFPFWVLSLEPLGPLWRPGVL